VSTTDERPTRSPEPPPPPRPADLQVDRTWAAGKLRAFLAATGDIARFAGQTLRELPYLRLYVPEVFQQAGILILSSGLIIWFMQFVMGGFCGIESNYSLEQVGAPAYSGVFAAWCSVREMAPYMWGYILAAKVGCGLVAEIGSMRIGEEIDALETLGIRTKSYLVGTRVVAAWIAMPFLYVVGLGLMFLAEYLVVVVQLGAVSPGGYSLMFWLYQNPLDLAYSLAKVMAMGTVIVFVGVYYGYTARGGPVGVGNNTAKSMMVNLVLIHIVGMFGTLVFWGLAPNTPIAN
jgi:phospholipid/cholesterol/gamma-HCH transport system permease protein